MGNPPTAASPRIVSMDQFRGYTVVGMILVNFIGHFALVPDVFKHHNTYFSYADSIMPAFHFCVGFAMRLVLLRKLATETLARTYWHFVRRNLGLILIALVFFPIGHPISWNSLMEKGLWGFLAGPLKCDIWNTLAIIGVTSLFVLPIMVARASIRFAVLVGLCVLHVVISDQFYFNFMWGRPNWLDQYWGAAGERGLDGGPLGCVAWGVIQIAGSLAYDLLATEPKWLAVKRLAWWGAAFMVTGYGLSCLSRFYDLPADAVKPKFDVADSPVRLPSVGRSSRDWTSFLAEPPFVRPPVLGDKKPQESLRPGERSKSYWLMCKRVPTLPFILFATGFSAFLYAGFVAACDGTSFQIGVFRTFGVNPLAAYIIHLAVAHAVERFAPKDSPWSWIVFSFALYFLITYAMLRYLEKRKIFLRM
jgi:hypothetical protein